MIQIPGFRGTIRENHPLAAKTTWRIGGAAEILAVPADQDDLFVLLEAAKTKGIPLFVLGRGSNVLIDDAGLPGIVLQLGRAFRYFKRVEDTAVVGADYLMPALAKRVSNLGFSGFEPLIGIPGTVGAGIVINAWKGTGLNRGLINVLANTTYLDDGLKAVTINVQQLELGYRTSRLKGTSAIVTQVIFKLSEPDDSQAIKERMETVIQERRKKFPLSLPSAGSVFKRPKGFPSAGWLIEKSGLKGMQIGNAQISDVHANFIVNLGQASSDDVRNIIEKVQEKVFITHHVMLELEVVIFPDQPNWIKK